MRRFLVVTVVTAAVLAPACSSSGKDESTEPSGPTPTATAATACQAAGDALLGAQNAQDVRDMSLSWQPALEAATSTAREAGAQELADQLTQLDQAMVSIRDTSRSVDERAVAARTATTLQFEIPSTCADLGEPFRTGGTGSPATTASGTQGGA